MLSSRAISSEMMPSFRTRSAFPRTVSDREKPHFHRRQRIADLVGDAGRELPHGGQLLGNQELIAAALQSGTGVADVRHQVAEVIAHHPQFVFLGTLVGSLAIAAIQLRIGDHAAERKEHSIEEKPKQKAAQEERQRRWKCRPPRWSGPCGLLILSMISFLGIVIRFFIRVTPGRTSQ